MKNNNKKNAFYFILKAPFVLKIFHFCPNFFGHAGKQLDNAKFKFKIYDVTIWLANNFNTHTTRYLK